MDIETIECFLLNYFNEIRFVNTDVVIDEIVTISKENGVITPKNDKYIYNLQSLLIPSLEEVNRLLYLEIEKCDKILIRESGFIDKLMGRNQINEINISGNEWIITSDRLYNKYFKKMDNNIYASDNFEDLIIVGNRDINIIVHQNLNSFYIECKDIRVYQIKKSR